ncbi:hypothetical protein VKY48_14235 [Endobacterium cereale]|nr:hypothetical protein [Endobacterium cereale]
MMLVLAAPPSYADEAAFKPLLIEPAKTLTDRCRNGIVAHRIEKWHKRDHLGVPQPSSFDSVEKIMRDMAPEAIGRLEDNGCDPRYLWGFIGCTALDDPNFKSEKIVSRGVTADTDEEMAVIMKTCIDGIANAGVSPAL